jgi:L-iditol 2-dehydrogenase
MNTLKLVAPQQLALLDVDLPPIQQGGGLLRVTACGICGTDLEKKHHATQTDGVVLGHELVGTLISLCPSYKGRLCVGDRLVVAHHAPCGTCHYCLNDSESMCRQFKTTNIYPGGFSSVVVLTAAHLKHTAFRLPAKVPDERAIHVEPLACILKAIRRGGAYHNGRTLVVGLGYIGLMASQLYALRGDDVVTTDISLERLRNARQFNVQRTAFLPQQMPYTGFDVVFLTVVNETTMGYALQHVRDGGTIVLFAGNPAQPTPVNTETLYHREIRLVPSYSPALQDLKAAVKLIQNKSMILDPLVTHRGSLTEAANLFDAMGQPNSIKAVVYPQGVPNTLATHVFSASQSEPDPNFASK